MNDAVELNARVESLITDVRHAIRSLRAAPRFAVLAVLCLSLGIGANATVFSVVNGVLLQPLPFDEPDRLLTLSEVRRSSPANGGPVSYLNFLDWQEASDPVMELAAMRSLSITLTDGAQSNRPRAALATWNLFPMLGIQPALGRGLRQDDDRAGAAPVVALSDPLWQRQYDADAAVIGRSILIDGTPRTVVGVMPPLDHPGLPNAWRAARLWLPLRPVELDSRRDERALTVYARLSADIQVDGARALLTEISRELEARHAENDGWGVRVGPLASVSANIQSLLTLAMGAVGFVLLIACSNVANLMLARSTRRRRDIGIQIALGLTRGRMVRQLLIESVGIGLLSVPLGVLLASWGIDLLLRMSPVEQAAFLDVPIDARVLTYTTGLAMVTSLVFGLAPALHTVRGSTLDALRTGSREASGGRGQTRVRHGLALAGTALSMVLLVGGSLFGRSFVNMLEAEGNFDTGHLLTLGVDLQRDRYPSPDAVSRTVGTVVARLGAVPGVESAAASDLQPLRGGGTRANAIAEGSVAADAPSILYGGVTRAWFDTIDMPLLQGRLFTVAESRTRSAVAIVNRRMADLLWPDGQALGGRFRLADHDADAWYTVVGVARDISTWDLSSRPRPSAYLPYPHVAARTPLVLVRAAGDPTRVAAPALTAIGAIDPRLPVFGVQTLDEIHRLTFWRQRMGVWVFTIFGVIAVVMASIGVYGVLSYLVSQRTRELGVRLAVGADRRDIVRLIVRQGMTLVLGGIAVGLVGGLGVTQVAQGQLYEVGAVDPLSFAGAALLLAAIGWCACHAPARRAAATDPIVCLRD